MFFMFFYSKINVFIIYDFHVHFSNPWHAFASHGLPAIAELLVFTRDSIYAIARRPICYRPSVRL